MIENAEPPKVLYKYKKADLFITLERLNAVYLTNPVTFNDPYDCLYHVITAPGNTLGGGQLEHMKEEIKKIEGHSGFGCFCLTSDPKNILMWSHYGGKHEGICIGYNMEEMKIGDIFKVDYTWDYANFNNMFGDFCGLMGGASFYKDSPERQRDINNRICTLLFAKKARDWCYENEWRIVAMLNNQLKKSHKDNRAILIDPNLCINSIILGARMPKERKDLIRYFIKNKYPQIVVKHARLSNDNFELTMEEYSN